MSAILPLREIHTASHPGMTGCVDCYLPVTLETGASFSFLNCLGLVMLRGISELGPLGLKFHIYLALSHHQNYC